MTSYWTSSQVFEEGRWHSLCLLRKFNLKSCRENFTACKQKQLYCLYFQNIFSNYNGIPKKHIRTENLGELKRAFTLWTQNTRKGRTLFISLFFNSKFHAWRNACIKKIFSINIVLIWVEMSPIIYSYVIYDEFSSLKICLECWEKKSLYFYALRSLYLISNELYMTHFIIHCA